MVKPATCRDVFNGHCQHWGLTEAAHALLHAQTRLINEVAEADKRSGQFGAGTSGSSIVHDGPRLEELLADEGYAVVPLVVI